MPFPESLVLLALALALEAALGYPAALYKAVGHPVTWMGMLITRLDAALNREAWSAASRCAAGAGALALVLTATALAASLLAAGLRRIGGAFAPALLELAATSLLAQRSLYAHVARVAEALRTGGLAGGRAAVAHIVGRNPETLDAAGVCRAAIESLAENFSDGVVAPAFWFAVLGLPGLVAYKAVNTADSMIGHRTPRHAAFGWAAARFDDALNLVPARLSGLLMALAGLVVGAEPASALAVMRRDAPRHRSPNAGWPEAAMAAALGLVLAGPRRYGAQVIDDPFLNPQGRAAARPEDIARALHIFVAACVLHAGLYAGVASFLA
jgi:adenosylcobinamide-phosphate synthase